MCECVCGNIIEVDGYTLFSGQISSCGCVKLERITNLNKKYNQYDFDYENNLGYCYPEETKEIYFIFNINDYDIIKYYYWQPDRSYWRTATNGLKFSVHQLIMCNGKIDEISEIKIDHKNRNPSDNTRDNLRFCSNKENARNRSMQPNNTSGIIGVNKRYENGWRAYISDERKQMMLGVYREFQDAVIARLKAEKEIFGEFAPQRHLFEEYGII